MKHLTTVIFSVLASLLVACGGSGDGSTTVPTGKLSVSLTDAPVDNAEAVVIHYTRATIQPDNGDPIIIDIINPDDLSSGRSIDLLQFTGEKSTVLFDEAMPVGKYSWIRLDVDFDPLKTYIQIAGMTYPLDCNSCANTGLKLNRSFDVTVDNTMAFTLDFDLRKSITDPSSSNNYKLRPTIRIIETAAAGGISGTVDATLISSLGGAEGCVVYIYEGSNLTPNDIFTPELGSPPTGFNNPTSTTPVELNDASIYEYTAAYLPAGEYTVSLTCDAENDDPLVAYDAVNFTGTTNASVTAGTTLTVDFPLPAP